MAPKIPKSTLEPADFATLYEGFDAPVSRYDIPTSLQLENRGMRETVVWRVMPHP